MEGLPDPEEIQQWLTESRGVCAPDADGWPSTEGCGLLYKLIGVSVSAPYEEVFAATKSYLARPADGPDQAAFARAVRTAFGSERSRSSYDSLTAAAGVQADEILLDQNVGPHGGRHRFAGSVEEGLLFTRWCGRPIEAYWLDAMKSVIEAPPTPQERAGRWFRNVVRRKMF